MNKKYEMPSMSLFTGLSSLYNLKNPSRATVSKILKIADIIMKRLPHNIKPEVKASIFFHKKLQIRNAKEPKVAILVANFISSTNDFIKFYLHSFLLSLTNDSYPNSKLYRFSLRMFGWIYRYG